MHGQQNIKKTEELQKLPVFKSSIRNQSLRACIMKYEIV